MPKEINGMAGRKPPEASANHSGIDDWFRRQVPHLRPIVQASAEPIRATLLAASSERLRGGRGNATE